jgi:L-rhamnose mutarotase
MSRYCFALDLKNDQSLIQEYEAHHKNVWPGIIASLKESGIQNAEIYRTENRLFMILETLDSFSLEKKVLDDSLNPMVQQWEQLMWRYQQALPNSKPGEKWALMNRIFTLK